MLKKIYEGVCNFWRERIFSLFFSVIFMMLIFIPSLTVRNDPVIFPDTQCDMTNMTAIEGFLNGNNAAQSFSFDGYLSGIKVFMATYEKVNRGKILFTLSNDTQRKIMFQDYFEMDKIKDNQFHLFHFGKNIKFNKGNTYSFTISGTPDCKPGNAVTCWSKSTSSQHKLILNGKKSNLSLLFRGVQKKRAVIWFILCSVCILLTLLLKDAVLIQLAEKPERVFLVVGSISVVLILFWAHPAMLEDWSSHLTRSYQISEGKFFYKPSGDVYISPQELLWVNTICSREVESYNGGPMHISDRSNMFDNIPFDCGTVNRKYTIMGYTPFNYIPQACMAWIARKTNMSLYHGISAIALISAIAYLLCIYKVIEWTPYFKWQILLLALSPAVFVHGISISSDAAIIYFSFILFAVVWRLQKKSVPYSFMDLLLLWIAAVIFCQGKFVYFPCLIIIAFLPVKNFKSAKKYVLYLFAACFSAVFLGYLWNKLATDMTLALNFGPLTPQEKIHFIIHHPLEFIKLFFKEIPLSFIVLRIKESVQCLCARDFLNPDNTRFYKIFNSYYILHAIVFFSSFIFFREKKWIWYQRIGAAMSVLFTAGLLFAALYCTNQFIGVQGRYFIPLFPMFCVIFGQEKWELPAKYQPYYKVLLGFWVIFSQFLVAEALYKSFWI